MMWSRRIKDANREVSVMHKESYGMAFILLFSSILSGY